MSRLPLKYKSNNDVQEMTTAEHNYLAYIAGLEIETASGTYSQTELGSLGKALQSNDLSIGTFTNTGRESGDVGDQGTDGSGDLAITTTTPTVIYQQNATSVSLHSDFRFPLYQSKTGNQQEIREFNDADQIALGETLAGIIYTNNYPGTFQLGTSAPSNDYAIAVANVMTDTRADDTSTVYNIYQRYRMTTGAPSAIDLMAVARGNSSPYTSRTGTYRGLKKMSVAHRSKTAKVCLQKYLSTMTPSVRPIGSYLIRTSEPTDFTGTWTAKGSAIDTRNVVEEETISADTLYTNINSSNHWQTTTSNPQDFLTDGISVKVGGSVVASAGATNTSDTTISGNSNGKTYTRGSAVSGAPSGSQWYEFTESGGSTTTVDEIKSGITNITTYTLYVRTA